MFSGKEIYFLPLYKKGVGGMKKLVNFIVIMVIVILPVAVRAEIIDKEGYELIHEGQFYINHNQYQSNRIEYAKTSEKIRLIEIEISAGICPLMEYQSGSYAQEFLSVSYTEVPYFRYRKQAAGQYYEIESSLIDKNRLLTENMVLKILIDNRIGNRRMKFKIEGIEGEFESFWSTYILYFCGLVKDGKERVVNYKVYDLDENLDLEDEGIWDFTEIIYGLCNIGS